MSRIVLTGATGLVGARALTLLRERHDVHAIVRSLPQTCLEGVVYHEKDLSHPWTAYGLPDEIDAVLHLAQSREFRDFPGRALETFFVNTSSTAVLLDYAVKARARQFVLASTGGLYGPSDVPITEDTPLLPPREQIGNYFDTKQSAEILTRAYFDRLNVTLLRPFFIYGPRQSRDQLVPRLVENVRSGKLIMLKGNSGSRLNPVYVDDVVHVLEACLVSERTQILNVAGPDVLTVKEIADVIGRVMSLSPVFECQDGKPDVFIADISRMRSLCSAPLTSFASGIAVTISALDPHSGR